jgi:hypothetical protein
MGQCGVMETYFDNGVVCLYQTDARSIPLDDQTVHCVVTSPPYYGLRVYAGNDNRGIGVETSVDAYVANMVDVFREVKRVLRDDGVCWLNLGDSYTGGGRGDSSTPKQSTNIGSNQLQPMVDIGLDAGNRIGIPERVVMALQADGWIWRDTVIWAKKSTMPESLAGWRWEQCRVKVAAGELREQKLGAMGMRDHSGETMLGAAQYQDCPGCPKCAGNDGLVLRKGSWRNTSSHEYIYMLTKGMGYYADGEAIKTLAVESSIKRVKSGFNGKQNVDVEIMGDRFLPGGMANRRSVWSDISPEPYGGAHFATFPSDLPRICIQASTSEKGVCSECGSQWARVTERVKQPTRNMEAQRLATANATGRTDGHTAAVGGLLDSVRTVGWRPTCNHNAPAIPATVLDPFAGTFTTGYAAQKLGRLAVGTDISETYLNLAIKRLMAVPLPMREI